MAGKRYYWLKLQVSFFQELIIKQLRTLPEGDSIVLLYLHDIGYTVEYELLQEAHLQDSFDSATGSVDVKKFAEDGVIHVYSNETGKDVAQIPLTKMAELEKEVKDFVEYKLSAYKVANPTKRSDLLPKSIYAFDIPNEIARVKRYKEYAEYCLKQLEQMQKEG
jgi:hypothetical protein